MSDVRFAVITSWRQCAPQRAKVRALRARLVEVCAGITDETPEYYEANDAVEAGLDELPRWQRLYVFTEPRLSTPRRGTA